MLAAMEDLLDSWPGTLLVVSHDRYLLERVTDQQYALLDGEFRNVPGGVDQYLEILKARPSAGKPTVTTTGKSSAAASSSSAEARAARKELGAVERKLTKTTDQIAALHATMAAHDLDDFTGLNALNEQLKALQSEVTALEERWMELAQLVD